MVCDICLEETCKGKRDCNCKTCKVKSECPRFLHATVRITNRCTQKCGHCCFNSSPSSDIMMSVDMASNVAKFFTENEVRSINLMGGEFFCNPDWYVILNILIDSVLSIRLVSNGDWALNEEVKELLSELIAKNKGKLRIAISKDKWHTNKNVDTAEEFLKEVSADYHIAEEGEMTTNSIVPVGRSEYGSMGIYSMMGCYCSNPVNKYSFLIDEEGNIYKCSFGILKYANINDYLSGGFSVRFKEFNKRFYDCFIPSCASCVRAISMVEGDDRCVTIN